MRGSTAITTMSALRRFIACLLMLALPLQGLAATAMVHCGGHAHHHVVAPLSGDSAPLSQSDVPSNHKCSACAYCCHAVALAGVWIVPQFEALGMTDLAEPSGPIPSTTLRLPDKPPRA